MSAKAFDFLSAIVEFGQTKDSYTPSQDRAARLAVVISSDAAGVVVQFEGEDDYSEKGYARLASYTPAVGDRVLMSPVGRSFVILGRVTLG